MPRAPPDTPAYYGHIETTGDALRVVYAARQGAISRITRRLNESERKRMIKSGNVFVFSVEESGIKRWTDGRMWSPSRIVGNFLVYREMNERGQSRVRVKSNASDTGSQASQEGTIDLKQPPLDPPTFKIDGLLKKTITVTINNSDLHLIAYFTQAEVGNGTLRRPTSSSTIMQLVLPAQLFQLSNLRNPPRITTGSDGRSRIDDEVADQEPVPASSSNSSDWSRRSWQEERSVPPLQMPRRSTISNAGRQAEPSSYAYRGQSAVPQNHTGASTSSLLASQGGSRMQQRSEMRPSGARSTSLHPAVWQHAPAPNWLQREDPVQSARWHQTHPIMSTPWDEYRLGLGSTQEANLSTQMIGSSQMQHSPTSSGSMPPSPVSPYHFNYSSSTHPYGLPPVNTAPRELRVPKMEEPQNTNVYPGFQPTPSYTLARANDMEHNMGYDFGRH